MNTALWFAIGVIMGGAVGFYAYKILATVLVGVQMLQRIAKIRAETRQGVAQTLEPIAVIRQGSQGETSQILKTPTPRQIKERQQREFAKRNGL
jgi:hypothetical protein